jgi:hypothetical protein
MLNQLLILFVSASLLYICYRRKNKKFFELYEKLPKIKGGWPFLGHLYKCFGMDQKKLLHVMLETLLEGPSPRRFCMGHECFICVDDPDQVRKVLFSKGCLDKSFLYNVLPSQQGLWPIKL